MQAQQCTSRARVHNSRQTQSHIRAACGAVHRTVQRAVAGYSPLIVGPVATGFSGPAVRPSASQFHRLARSRRATTHAAGRAVSGPSDLPSEADVVVVGAGIAGLAAALKLQAAGLNPLVLEAADGVGGRVRTDQVDGYLLDRGFQIFLTGYPEAQAVLDYPGLQLQTFYAGALVRWQQGWHRLADPLRHPVDGILSLTNPIGSVVDKVLVGIFRFKSLLGSLEALLQQPETSTLQKLQAEGFSQAMISRFFAPFLGGIFFDRNLGTTSRMFTFVMRMLAVGSNCLPTGGIGAVSEQLAGRLPADSVCLGARVTSLAPAVGSRSASVTVSLAGGGSCTVTAPRGVVVAVEGPEAQRLLGSALGPAPSKVEPGVGTCCLYFTAPKPPLKGNILYLNGEESGIVNNACFPSEVAPSYAPPGKTLCSVSTIGTFDSMTDVQLEAAVRSHLNEWFGASELATWQLLRIYRIPFAQPNQAPPTNFFRPVALGGSLFVAGDHRDSATLDGALVSGKRAAQALLDAKLPQPVTAVTQGVLTASN